VKARRQYASRRVRELGAAGVPVQGGKGTIRREAKGSVAVRCFYRCPVCGRERASGRLGVQRERRLVCVGCGAKGRFVYHEQQVRRSA